MHDLMHDLASSVARSCFLYTEQENRPYGKVRHLNYYFESNNMSRKIPMSLLQEKKLRTMMPYNLPYSKSLATIMSNWKLLRALDLSQNGLETLPSGLGDLIHLRFLDLTGNKLEELPKSITRLHNLETLILSNCDELLCFPRDITGLLNLRHLDTRYCHKLKYLPSGIGQLTSLQTLGLFPVPNDSMALSGYVAGLNELKYLNNLKGKLRIKIMGHGKHALARCETANFKDINLQSLYVYWSENYYTIESKEDYKRKLDLDMAENDEAILDFLQPNPIMKEFSLRGYMGARISQWISSLSNLVKLYIADCRNLESIPCLDQLHGLKEFNLNNLPKLEFISTRDDDTFSPATLPLLELLSIWYCPKLKRWWQKERKNNTDGKDECNGSNYSTEQTLHLHPPFFPSLTKLDILECPRLTSMPLFPYVEELSLGNFNLQVLLEFMCNLSSLQSLTLSSLDLDSLPPEFGNLKSLEFLHIFDSYNLASLPESVGNLSSLRSLRLDFCTKLVELPEAILRLKSLQSLYSDNSLSKERYERNSGKEWPKIAHIRNVTVR